MALILIVDDEEDVREALRALLEADGHRVIEATDGEELLPTLRTHWPDLVLLDQRMPKVTGFEALEMLRQQEWGQKFPVIIVSAAGSPQEAQQARMLGVKEYIGKPWASGEIEMRIKWVLQQAERPVRIPAEKILIVDDVEHVRTALVTTLEDAGYEAAAVGSGEEAVQVAPMLAPNLILMDLRMPGIGGLAAIQHIRANAVTVKTPIVIVTAAASQESVQMALSLGVNGFLVKPWHPRDLETRVRAVMDQTALLAGVAA